MSKGENRQCHDVETKGKTRVLQGRRGGGVTRARDAGQCLPNEAIAPDLRRVAPMDPPESIFSRGRGGGTWRERGWQ